jgi:hypothetical protein
MPDPRLVLNGIVVLANGPAPVHRPQLEEPPLLGNAAHRRGGAASVSGHGLLHGRQRSCVNHGIDCAGGGRELGRNRRLGEGRGVDRREAEEALGLADGDAAGGGVLDRHGSDVVRI